MDPPTNSPKPSAGLFRMRPNRFAAREVTTMQALTNAQKQRAFRERRKRLAAQARSVGGVIDLLVRAVQGKSEGLRIIDRVTERLQAEADAQAQATIRWRRAKRKAAASVPPLVWEITNEHKGALVSMEAKLTRARGRRYCARNRELAGAEHPYVASLETRGGTCLWASPAATIEEARALCEQHYARTSA
jgi:hypothetical protein